MLMLACIFRSDHNVATFRCSCSWCNFLVQCSPSICSGLPLQRRLCGNAVVCMPGTSKRIAYVP